MVATLQESGSGLYAWLQRAQVFSNNQGRNNNNDDDDSTVATVDDELALERQQNRRTANQRSLDAIDALREDKRPHPMVVLFRKSIPFIFIFPFAAYGVVYLSGLGGSSKRQPQEPLEDDSNNMTLFDDVMDERHVNTTTNTTHRFF